MKRVVRWIGVVVLIVLTLYVTFGIGNDSSLPVMSLRLGTGSVVPDDDLPVELLANSESAERTAYGREMRELLYTGQYDSLEHIAARLRDERTQWRNGDWKLRTFYYVGFDLATPDDSEAAWVALDEHIRRWIAARPLSITARIARTHLLVGYAGNARGEGPSATVGDSGRRLSRERLAEARAMLTEASTVGANCPGWYAAAQRVALGEGWDRQLYDTLFANAVAREPTYFGYYELRAQYLLPQWYGQNEEWQRDAEAIANRQPGLAGDEIYARIAWAQWNDSRGNFFADSTVSWARTKRGFKHMIQTHPNSLELRSEFALLASQAGDREEVRRQFAKLGGRMDAYVWDNTYNFRQVRKWVFADD